MKFARWIGTATQLCLLTVLQSTEADAVPNEIVHVGVLIDAQGQPFHGQHAFRVQLFDRPVGGVQLFEELHPAIRVTDGFCLHPVWKHQQPALRVLQQCVHRAFCRQWSAA